MLQIFHLTNSTTAAAVGLLLVVNEHSSMLRVARSSGWLSLIPCSHSLLIIIPHVLQKIHKLKWRDRLRSVKILVGTSQQLLNIIPKSEPMA